TLVGAAYREVTATLEQAAGLRAQAGVEQYKDLLAQSAQQRVVETRRAAALPAVHEFLADPTDARREAMKAAFDPPPVAGTNPGVGVGTGGRGVSAAAPHATAATACAPEPPPQSEGVDALRVVDNVVTWRVVASIGAPGQPGSGFLVVRRPIVSQQGADV